MDLHSTIKSLKPVKGQRLSSWLKRFLTADSRQLAQWQGTWTEVNTAKVVEILRKRGVVEEHEANEALFGRLVNAIYRAPVFVPPAQEKKEEAEGPQNPFAFSQSDLEFARIGRQAEPGAQITNCGDCWCWGGDRGSAKTAQIAESLGCPPEAVRAILGAYFKI